VADDGLRASGDKYPFLLFGSRALDAHAVAAGAPFNRLTI
jgi:hypothetical protein